MALRVELDHAFAVADSVGGGAGLTRRHLVQQVGRFRDIHADLESASADGLLPHCSVARDLSAADEHTERGRQWREHTSRLIVVGEPGTVCAVRVLAELAGPANPRTSSIRWIDSPDAVLIDAAFDGAVRPHLVVLDGPPWVRVLGHTLRPKSQGATVFVGDGTDHNPWSLDEAERIVGPGAADPRFGVFGSAALSLAAYAQLDAASIVRDLAAMAERCRHKALFDNPAYVLAATFWAAERDLGLEQPALLIPSPRLSTWGGWMQRSWTAITAKTQQIEGVWVPGGATPMLIQAGDEALVQRLVEGRRNQLVVVLWVDEPGHDLAIGQTRSAWTLARTMMVAHVQQLVSAGRPVLRIRLPDFAPETVGQLSYLFLHTALALTAGRQVDPLSMPASDRWRDVQRTEFEGE